MDDAKNEREHLAVWPPCASIPGRCREQLAIEDEDYEWRRELRIERTERMRGLVSIAKAAAMLGVSKPQVYWLIRHSGLPCVKLATRWTMIPEDEFMEWCESRGR